METTLPSPTTQDVTPNALQAARGGPLRRAVPRAERPIGFFDLSLEELEERLRGLGQPAYRGRQLFGWAYRQLVDGYGAMGNLPAGLRRELTRTLPFSTLAPVREVSADDGKTIKTLYRTGDGELIETVLMLYPDRATVCVS